MRFIWWVLPDELLPLVVVGVAMLVMVRAIRFRTAIGVLFGFLVLPVLLGPVIEVAMSVLPLWLVLLVGAAVLLELLRSAISLLIGARATDHLVGNLATDCVRGLVGLCVLPFTIVGLIWRAALNPRRS